MTSPLTPPKAIMPPSAESPSHMEAMAKPTTIGTAQAIRRHVAPLSEPGWLTRIIQRQDLNYCLVIKALPNSLLYKQ